MSSPSQLCFINHGLQARDIAARKDLIVCYFMEPLNASNLTQGSLVKLLQVFALLFCKGPYKSEVMTAAL